MVDFDLLARAWKEREERKKHEEAMVIERASEKARRAAAFLREKYGVRKVYLYGSLARGRGFDVNSDIDLLVEGFPEPDRFWRMVSELWDITTPHAPSVVLVEDALPSLVERVRKEGVELLGDERRSGGS